MTHHSTRVRTARFAVCALTAASLTAAVQGQQKDRATDDARNGSRTEAGATPERQPERQPVRLGVRIERSSTTGVHVTDVAPSGPAARAGIQRGDYLLSMNGKTISSPQDFQRLMQTAQPGEKATFLVWRNQARRTVAVMLPRTQATSLNSSGGGESRAWLGVQVTTAKGKQGAQVVAVYPSGPASFAGIEHGDQIIKVGDQSIKDPSDVTAAIKDMKPDKEVKIVVMRDGEEQTLTATLGNMRDYISADAAPPRGGNSANRNPGDFNGSMRGVPGHAMMLEQHRRFAQQHQRIEKLVLELTKEVQELREEVRSLNGGNAKRPAPKREARKDEPRNERE